MSTVVNTPNGSGSSADSGVGVIVGVLIVLVVLVLFFVYGLPAIRSEPAQQQPAQVNVQIPTGALNPNPGATSTP